jgi:hypothetical protein
MLGDLARIRCRALGVYERPPQILRVRERSAQDGTRATDVETARERLLIKKMVKIRLGLERLLLWRVEMRASVPPAHRKVRDERATSLS